MTFNSLLEEIDALPSERQEELLDIVRRRLAEKRPHEIARNAAIAHELHAKGALPRGSVGDLMRELQADTE